MEPRRRQAALMRFSAFRFAKCRNAHLSLWARNFNSSSLFQQQRLSQAAGSAGRAGGIFNRGFSVSTLRTLSEASHYGFCEQALRSSGSIFAPNGFGDAADLLVLREEGLLAVLPLSLVEIMETLCTYKDLMGGGNLFLVKMIWSSIESEKHIAHGEKRQAVGCPPQ